MPRFLLLTSTLLLLHSLTLPFANAQLNLLARANRKLYFGTATDNGELTDVPYVKELGNTLDFGQITAANGMKWFATEPERGVFNFTLGDQIADLAIKNKQILRGHNCVWHSQLAPWVEAGNFDNATLTSIVANHCSTLVKHYKGKIYSWDVINECLNDDGTFRESVFFNTTGTSYIGTALRAARAADPHAKLYINDFNIEAINAKSDAMISLVQSLQAQKIPIDGVGVQSHLIVGQVPTDFQQNLQRFVDILGVEVAITELDIRMTLPATDALLEQQKKDYESVITACKNVKRCVGVTVWDWTDKFSWVPGTFVGEGEACPWDENLNKKPAYFGIVDAWKSFSFSL